MQRFQEQSDPDFSLPMKDGDIVFLIQRMATVRYGQDRLLAAIQSLSDGDVVMLIAEFRQMDHSSLR